jgi:hypothetical protein
MKPQLRPSPARWLSRHDDISACPRLSPRLECNFQARRFGGFYGGSDSPGRRFGFSAFTEEARADASRRFRLESALLGFVGMVAAWPIALMIQEVIRFLAD